ncbi:hypothetical protein L2E82_31017 [Cichorium intybus]|uniref:Uncharacterized protein n=1 Tax=Cichorium intybus TaxID=13427 RepID=A0ACB9D1V7_CICIN|nr:hypothetical protein L2E82_31017 [Cichorium intybus]
MNSEVMLDLQIGVRHSVGRLAPTESIKLEPTAFDTEIRLWTRFPPEGSRHTPPHQSCEFKWKDYCLLVFRALRKLFNVDPADYISSICGNDALRKLSSPRKNGMFFYLTHDDKYMIKRIKKQEVRVLIRMLLVYYKPETEIDANTTLKDLDLKFVFRLQQDWFQEFRSQVNKDCDFLEQEKIFNYSLLVGVSFQDSNTQAPEVNSEPDSLGTTSNLSTNMNSLINPAK